MVTVIIPTHNRKEMLERAIASVQNQTYKDFELIVISDNSTDETNNFLQSLNYPNFKYFINTTSKGASAARNIGIQNSSGEYIAFLDDDDEWYDFHLEILVRKIKNSNSKVGLVYGWIDYYEKDKIVDSKYPNLSGDIFLHMLDKQAITNSSVLIIKATVLNVVKGFDESLLRGNDGDFIRRISKFFHVDYVPKVLCRVNVGHEDRITLNTKENLSNEIESYLIRLRKFKIDFKKYPQQKSNVLHKISISYLKKNNFSKSLIFLFKSIYISTSFKDIYQKLVVFIKNIMIKFYVKWN